ncbi:jg7474, partial [Pararge aegeria aegeria]
TPRYPPLVVEKLPNWAHHLRALKAKLGRTPSARPFGKGIKFTPSDEEEYRTIQRYLSELEKSENLSWFSYSLPQDRSLKVAIRGVPVDTDPDLLKEELCSLGFEPELVRPIQARQGRPGCIFFAVLTRTADLIPRIYEVDELLCMPGVRIEAWRGKKGPSQCHRCQKFRHSSHHCHRTQACVRCGEEHYARDCPRPKEDPATCVNCGGPHPANNVSCPVFRREARNKKAGTVAFTSAAPREAPSARPRTRAEEPSEVQDPPDTQAQAGAKIRTPANEPTPRGTAGPSKKKKRPKKGKKPTAAPTNQAPSNQASSSQAPPNRAPLNPFASLVGQVPREGTQPPPRNTTAPDNGRLRVIETAIAIFTDVLHALQAGEDPASVVLRGMSQLLQNSFL